MQSIPSLTKAFTARFNSTPRVFRSPGRINLIGEHVDYNNGFVMPAAIDKEIVVLMAPSAASVSRIYAYDLDESISFSRENYAEVTTPWAKYLVGIYDQLVRNGITPGEVDCLFTGNIPIGAGLSSSAALECATLAAYNAIFDLHLDKMRMVHMAQKAENDFVGVMCGIMDQFASVFSKEGQVLKLDCRDMTFSPYPLNLEGYQLILVDSMVTHSLASSEYNIRREQCEQGVALLQHAGLEISSLREVTREQLDLHESILGAIIYKRCKYVVDEIERVQLAAAALENNDLVSLGRLLYETHDGLSKEYDVSCPELDFLVDLTRDNPNVTGSRLMGGGFGGCTLNLVATDHISSFRENVTHEFYENYKKRPNVYSVNTANGTSELILNQNKS